MDRAENIKKYLDQEKEGKEAVLESMCMCSCDKAHFTQCFWLCPLELAGLLCISIRLYTSCS